MTWNRAFWLLALVLVGGVLAVVLPDSPFHLSRILVSDKQYQGRGTGYWIGELSSSDAAVRAKASFALGAIGPGAADAVPALAARLAEDTDAKVRVDAALALAKIIPAAAAALPALTKAIEDDDHFVRMNATLALFRLGKDAKPAVPALLKGVNDPSNRTNLNAWQFTIQELMIGTLGRTCAGTDEAVPTLIDILKGADTTELRIAVVQALAETGVSARAAAPELRALLTHRSEVLRKCCEEALKNIEAN